MFWNEKPCWAASPVVCVWCVTQNAEIQNLWQTHHFSHVREKNTLSLSSNCVFPCLTAAVGFIVLLSLFSREGLCVWFYTCALLSVEISVPVSATLTLSANFIYEKLNWTMKDLYFILCIFLCLQSKHSLAAGGKNKRIQHDLNILIICTNL